MRINLSGLQSIKPPASLFDEWVKYNESHLKESKWPEGVDVWADVVWDKENKYQEKEKALLVTLDNCPIGYIPVLSTIERYVNEAWKARGEAMAALDADGANAAFKRWEKEQGRYSAAKVVRDGIESDLFVSHIPVRVRIGNVLVSDFGEVLSVSIDYEEE